MFSSVVHQNCQERLYKKEIIKKLCLKKNFKWHKLKIKIAAKIHNTVYLLGKNKHVDNNVNHYIC